MKFWNKVKRLCIEDSGISSVEYALLLGLIGSGYSGSRHRLWAPRWPATSTMPRQPWAAAANQTVVTCRASVESY